MGKDKSEKKEKKDKKRSETDGVRKEKKEKKKDKKLSDVAEKEIVEQLENTADDVEANVEMTDAAERPIGALVPFADPLVEDKTAKKVFKTVKKGIYSTSPGLCSFC